MIQQQCTVDSDCPDGYVCVDGQCVPRDGVPPNGETGGGTNWLLVGGVGLAILALAAIAKKK